MLICPGLKIFPHLTPQAVKAGLPDHHTVPRITVQTHGSHQEAHVLLGNHNMGVHPITWHQCLKSAVLGYETQCSGTSHHQPIA